MFNFTSHSENEKPFLGNLPAFGWLKAGFSPANGAAYRRLTYKQQVILKNTSTRLTTARVKLNNPATNLGTPSQSDTRSGFTRRRGRHRSRRFHSYARQRTRIGRTLPTIWRRIVGLVGVINSEEGDTSYIRLSLLSIIFWGPLGVYLGLLGR